MKSKQQNSARSQPAAATGTVGAKAQAIDDRRPEAAAQRQLQDIANNSPQAAALQRYADVMANSPRTAALQRYADLMNNSPRMAAQRKALEGMFGTAAQRKAPEEELLQGRFEIAQRERLDEEEPLLAKAGPAEAAAQREEAPAPVPNNTGLPDELKAGIENLSGLAMDDVRVHYHSDKPAQLQAHAYTQGTEIHVAPGQEKHLAHEAWHVVQQKQGRVRATRQMKEGVAVNDDASLEREADVMGANAIQMMFANGVTSELNHQEPERTALRSMAVVQRQLIGNIEVYVDNANYPYWTSDGLDWHLTMKDGTRWHITLQDRSASYWFEVDGGTVTSVKPNKQEFGGHPEKHFPLDKAPAATRAFIKNHLSEIMAVTDKER
jgi:hypothetical protein